ncbi:MAG: hypothetical protein M3237_14220 [Actinomycetota bacterium]|nr:hypothetical protein [Actinomycetota bacterium]
MRGFLDLINAGQDVNEALAFIQDGSMAALLNTIADVEVAAAKRAVEQQKTANDPRAYVHMALTHLQSAAAAYEKIVDSSKVGRSMTTPYEREVAGGLGTWVACCSALCHYALGETENLRLDIQRARRMLRVAYQLDTRQGQTMEAYWQKASKGGWSWLTAPVKAVGDPDMWLAVGTGAAYSARALVHPVRSTKALAAGFNEVITFEQLDEFESALLPDEPKQAK